jgi:2-polyprenyl-3-methyl-5-hydroxy-6-metoxy-1,4-benzoquinol methylase
MPASSHDLLRRRLLALPPGGSLLDLGAGPGHLGRAVRERYAYMAAVEADPEARAEGEGVYDRWITARVDGEIAIDRPFDVVVCADVLEHLADPSMLLARLRRWLAPGGRLLVSIPNVANLWARLSLAAGRFEYTDRGIFDHTHLRFYTRRSARRLLRESGFRIERECASAVPAELAWPALGHRPWRAPVRVTLAAAARLRPTLFGYQLLFEAR